MHLPPLHPGTLVRRYKRFLADVQLDDGRQVTAWCANPGRMTSCAWPGGRVWLSQAPPGRRLGWTWELAEDPGGGRILVHTGRVNDLVAEALEQGRLPDLAGYGRLQREVKLDGSRLDFALDDHPDDPRRCYLEVKSVTLHVGDALAAFPDAVTARGRKHLLELQALAAQGHRAVLLFSLGREDCAAVRPAGEVDPAYAETLRQVAGAGVELRCHGLRFGQGALWLEPWPLPVQL